MKSQPPDKEKRLTPVQQMLSWGYVLFIVLLGIAANAWLSPASVELDYSDFKVLVREAKVREVQVAATMITGTAMLHEAKERLDPAAQAVLAKLPAGDPVPFTTARIEDDDLVGDLERAGVRFSGAPDRGWITGLMSWFVPLLLLIAFWVYATRRLTRAGGADLVGASKSNAKVFVQKSIDVRFADVEGIDEAKAELLEVVEFLRRPDRYTKLGAHIPKGVLIVGAPGTGKTLLAKAVAGEADVPFLSINGSEFVEMFVGVGAARVRDLFHQAEQLAPCIIFIDELDALGKARGFSNLGGHEEREQTLNQLLVEIDGFNSNRGVIIMAATNRPEILDPALLRPGRFDRHVAIDRPDINGRERILRLHAKRLTLAPDVDLRAVAARTPGSAGADLANIVNEAALHAARENKQAVGMADFESAIDRAIAGLEKKGRVMNPREKETVAYHEAGHALIAELRATTDRVAKVSIIPRGIGALGFTQQLPTEDRYLLKHRELLDRMDMLVGGRVAELLVFGEASTGAQNDLQRATDLARHMVAQYGMSEALGLAVLDIRSSNTFLGEPGMAPRREYSERTARLIDAEVQRLLRDAETRVRATLIEHRKELEALAHLLLVQETVERAALLEVLTPRPEPGAAGAPSSPSPSATDAVAAHETPTSFPRRSTQPSAQPVTCMSTSQTEEK